ncbi:outer membrane transport energization protein TonB [Hephaestia caeni]|uniref:Outer membrane transport energization protein TonB n=1 Tax=Hephaestia caeni TaxID=645617 RepID=A0A397NMP1_9SPHN|nr:TonB family protein [Hephaestia caeni]RIA37648.1 outer membrane transport energization protein TonB [Hephaestia caeni]
MAVAEPSTRTRLSSAGLSAAIVALAGYALVTGLNVPFPRVVDSTLKVFGVAPPPPPPPPPPPEKVTIQPRLSPKAEGKAAPPNITSRATPVAAPTPIIPLPVPPVVVTSIKPFEGPDPTQGNADIRGPGTGAGGIGDGTGSGGRGDGGGAGGNSPPRHTGGRIRNSDYPASAGAAGAGGVVSVEYYVLPSGRVSNCHITHSSGNQALDETTCRLITERYRYEPSRTADGTPVRSIIVADHEWIIDDSMLKALRKEADR